ncbi:MAG: HAD-IIIC family phosphatase, partial [Alphaproteobacteria bacterium]|nr:HAD-IIIC family phosphatase [Alphaproteobacteria bacterium]
FFKRHTYPCFKILQTSFFIWLNRINTKKLSKIRYPDIFVLDVINLEEFSLDIKISFTQKTAEENLKYDEIIKLDPGLNKHAIDYNKIVLAIGDVHDCLIEITIVNDQEAVLKFTALDFVKINDRKLKADSCHEVKNTDKSKPKVKCLVFDLDNTLWDGTLITDGLSGINLKSIVIDTIRKLDKLGILFSIASKNNFEDAQKVLSEIKMHEYFLCPQIHWGIKSESIKRIAKRLNIGIDTIAFIDDSPFELAEVSSALPEVRCYQAKEIDKLPEYDEFNVPMTKEAENRRSYYRTQQNFEENEKEWKEERLDFLKNCQMVLAISKPGGAQIERCYELLQRTNQLNLSARRYSRKEFTNIVSDNSVECFVLQFKDKFGEYGIVGVAVVQLDDAQPKLIELAISCRVARRKVEQSFVCWLAQRYAGRGSSNFIIHLRTTNRNDLLMHAFEELNCRRKDTSGTFIEWMIPLDKQLPKQDVISVIEK